MTIMPGEKVRLPLPNGDDIVLVDMLAEAGAADEVNRNVYRVGANGRVLWQIETEAAEDERQPYTNIYFDADGTLKAYCWNGAEYPVDLTSGAIGRGILVR